VTLSPIIREVTRVLARFPRRIRGRDSPRPRVRFKIRDPDDAIILEAAIDTGADVLVSGDRDPLDARGVTGLLIVDPRGFRNLVARID
jgi:predicted nucleic acid-binding protein